MNAWIYSRFNQVILDACCFAIAFITAFVIRFESWPHDADLNQMLGWLPIILGARLLSYWGFGIYRQIWKFVSFTDAIEITKSLSVVSFSLLALRLSFIGAGSVSAWFRLPLSIIALEGLGSLAACLAIRGLRRAVYLRERKILAATTGLPSKRVLLYGAGRAGIMLYKEIYTNHSYDVVGFIDDDSLKVGSQIEKVPVLGSGKDLSQLVALHKIDEIIVSMASASRPILTRVLALCRHAGVAAKIIPSLQEIITGQVQITQIREPQIEEILGRESIEMLDFEQVAGSTYRDKCILVTGAGGSIGSELVRQICRLQPRQIGILDKDENSIFELEHELRLQKCTTSVEPFVADVRDPNRLRAVFSSLLPELVFHAAAHKHVPLMEKHPCEAVLNNIGGTQNVLALSREFRAERFVFISSDKAVNPANVMGATKRIGELLVQASVDPNGPRVACVRFGNVLGSRGSVVPLFKKQIAHGGPITITHPEITRYFMTIQEAVQLIICAGTLAEIGEIFVLDMGNPRKIVELAREMVLLSGLDPDKDIETQITGLRPGEKLFEELVGPAERLLKTSFEKLSFVEPQVTDSETLMRQIAVLIQTARSNNQRGVFDLLHAMDLGFHVPRQKHLALAAHN